MGGGTGWARWAMAYPIFGLGGPQCVWPHQSCAVFFVYVLSNCWFLCLETCTFSKISQTLHPFCVLHLDAINPGTGEHFHFADADRSQFYEAVDTLVSTIN